MADIAIIIEGGLVRGTYVDGNLRDAEVFDLDLEGYDEEELQDLLNRIDAVKDENDLRADLRTYRNDVSRALSYGDGLGA